jgi:hypothetical protein
VLSAVRQAEQRIVADGKRNKVHYRSHLAHLQEYVPLGGDPTFCALKLAASRTLLDESAIQSLC